MKYGLKVNEYGVFRINNGKEKYISGTTEESVFKSLGLSYIEPELREDTGEIELAATPVGVEIMAPPGMEEMTSQLQTIFQQIGSNRTKTRKMTVAKAIKIAVKRDINNMSLPSTKGVL